MELCLDLSKAEPVLLLLLRVVGWKRTAESFHGGTRRRRVLYLSSIPSIFSSIIVSAFSVPKFSPGSSQTEQVTDGRGDQVGVLLRLKWCLLYLTSQLDRVSSTDHKISDGIERGPGDLNIHMGKDIFTFDNQLTYL